MKRGRKRAKKETARRKKKTEQATIDRHQDGPLFLSKQQLDRLRRESKDSTVKYLCNRVLYAEGDLEKSGDKNRRLQNQIRGLLHLIEEAGRCYNNLEG